MENNKIKQVIGREILDSRGNPTVEVEVVLENGVMGRGVAPSGASTGIFEALELRDQDTQRYGGKGVQNAVNKVNNEINAALADTLLNSFCEVDDKLRKIDGTESKTQLGANAILATSMACAKAMASFNHMSLYRFLGNNQGCVLPVPMMNVLNGGCHAKTSGLDVQEFMIMPVGANCFKEALRWGAETYHALEILIRERGLTTSVGDEGGFAPDLKSDQEAIELLISAIRQAGYIPGKDFVLAMDAATSEWKSERGKGYYHLPKSKVEQTSDDLIKHWEKLCQDYPIFSIEDGLDEEDWDGWKSMTRQMGQQVQLVGDDLFVTNTKRLKMGIQNQCGNAILIKPNQIGTLSETIEAINMAHQSRYRAIVSHRSGETEDVFIADLAVALNCGQIKTGAPCRSERVAKYNQLLRIEEELGDKAMYSNLCAIK